MDSFSMLSLLGTGRKLLVVMVVSALVISSQAEGSYYDQLKDYWRIQKCIFPDPSTYENSSENSIPVLELCRDPLFKQDNTSVTFSLCRDFVRCSVALCNRTTLNNGNMNTTLYGLPKNVCDLAQSFKDDYVLKKYIPTLIGIHTCPLACKGEYLPICILQISALCLVSGVCPTTKTEGTGGTSSGSSASLPKITHDESLKVNSVESTNPSTSKPNVGNMPPVGEPNPSVVTVDLNGRNVPPVKVPTVTKLEPTNPSVVTVKPSEGNIPPVEVPIVPPVEVPIVPGSSRGKPRLMNFPGSSESPSSGHFIAYFLTASVICISGYVIFHNKQKIMAFVIEGRNGSGGARKRSGNIKYNQLKSNVEEVMPSLENAATSKSCVY